MHRIKLTVFSRAMLNPQMASLLSLSSTMAQAESYSRQFILLS